MNTVFWVIIELSEEQIIRHGPYLSEKSAYEIAIEWCPDEYRGIPYTISVVEQYKDPETGFNKDLPTKVIIENAHP